MVKRTSTSKKRAAGRPPLPVEDLRSARFSFRVHPDLHEEIAILARLEGEPISTFIERVLINRVNAVSFRPVLDKIGRRLPDSLQAPGVRKSDRP